MKREKISDALNQLDETYVQEAADYEKKRKRKSYRKTWIPLGTAAACLCIVMGGITIWQNYRNSPLTNPDSPVTEADALRSQISESGVTIPKMEVTLSLPNGVEADMIGFFIYQGRCYVELDWFEAEDDFVGEYLGTATGMIDEWTPKEGYVELAGSISGDFYSVNGYDPSFLLCMKKDDGMVATYINNNGITLKKGSDLFEERLHLANRYSSVNYQTSKDWNYDLGEPVPLEDTYYEVVDAFVEALNDSDFMLLSDIPLENENDNVYDSKEMYHLFFHMEDGMTIHLRLLEGGYVSLQGFYGVCVKMEGAPFENLIKVLSN